MNIVEEYFWKANMAFQTNRLNESYLFICQAIEHLNQSILTLEQLELIWLVIPSKYFILFLFLLKNFFHLEIIETYKNSIERLVSYHQSMPIETSEVFDYLTQTYINQLEENQENFYLKLIDYFDKYLIQDHHDIDHIHLKRLQADIYLQLSYVSRPYQCQLYYNKHRKILNDNEYIINMYRKIDN